jgi:phosphoserine phosphatase
MKSYREQFSFEIEKLNELENLCKEFNLEKIETPTYLTLYKNDELLVQNLSKKGKSKILISSNKKEIYDSFMEKFHEIYELCEN